jgi:hypothetical protein
VQGMLAKGANHAKGQPYRIKSPTQERLVRLFSRDRADSSPTAR